MRLPRFYEGETIVPGNDTHSRYDAAVVGGGPAGAAAARHLAARGARVVLLEREQLPRYKTCGGAVVLRAVRHADLPPGAPIRRQVNAAELHFHDADLHFCARRERVILWMTMRSDLDASLCAAAARAGAEVRDACHVTGLEHGAATNTVSVRTSHGRLQAGFVVAADGVASRTARWAGWRRTMAGIPAVEVELPVDAPMLQRFSESGRFDFGTVPNGYAWVFPKQEHLSIGILSTVRGKTALHESLEHYAKRLSIPLDAAVRRHGALIPLAPRRTLARDRVLLCGDAAGLVDPVTCEGISHALRSGALAAQAILECDGSAADARRRYRMALQGEILAELRHARVLAHVLYRNVTFRNWLFRRLGPSLCEAMLDVITGARTYRSVLASPHSYRTLLRGALRSAPQAS